MLHFPNAISRAKRPSEVKRFTAKKSAGGLAVLRNLHEQGAKGRIRDKLEQNDPQEQEPRSPGQPSPEGNRGGDVKPSTSMLTFIALRSTGMDSRAVLVSPAMLTRCTAALCRRSTAMSREQILVHG